MKIFTVERNSYTWGEFIGMAVVANDQDDAVRQVKDYVSKLFILASTDVGYHMMDGDSNLSDVDRLRFETETLYEYHRECRDVQVGTFDKEFITITEVDLEKRGVCMQSFYDG